MANYYRNEIYRAKDTETLNQIIEELAFADIDNTEYCDLFDEAGARLAELLTR